MSQKKLATLASPSLEALVTSITGCLDAQLVILKAAAAELLERQPKSHGRRARRRGPVFEVVTGRNSIARGRAARTFSQSMGRPLDGGSLISRPELVE